MYKAGDRFKAGDHYFILTEIKNNIYSMVNLTTGTTIRNPIEIREPTISSDKITEMLETQIWQKTSKD